MDIDCLINGDCLDVMPDIEDKSVDMVLCDLPFATTKCRWDVLIPFDKLWEQYLRVVKDDGAIVLFGTQPFTSALIMSNPTMFKYAWMWDKTFGRGHLVAKYRPMQQTEDVCVFGRGRICYYPKMIRRDRPVLSKERARTEIMGGKQGDGYRGKMVVDKHPTNLLTFKPVASTKTLHPTQKPVALCEYLIETYTQVGDTVLDNCMGSGSSIVACKNTRRHYIGIEMDKAIFDVAKKRVDELPLMLW